MKSALLSLPRLAIDGGQPVLSLDKIPGPHYRWPVITSSAEQAVLKQLSTAVSIKDRSGVVAELEDRFKSFYGHTYALSTNSGTAALFAAYDALQLKPGDEVLCPDYTWFATVSPLVYTGATPVFVDCDQNFNLDPALLASQYTPRTKAVVVTHMWGMPCAMPAITKFCRQHKLYLVEDCSHAHGAACAAQRVGTFGDIAVFSLQAAKLVPAGEGGILLTNNPELYYRVNLHGQYNKRCAQEIPSEHPLRPFWQTGFGLKQRIHPLGAALALDQFDHMLDKLETKRKYVRRFFDVIRGYPFLQLQDEGDAQSSWYMLAFEYREAAAGVTAQQFVQALHAEGLIEFDIPTLTGPIGDLHLFHHLHEAMPRLYSQKVTIKRSCPRSQSLREKVVVLPVWTESTDELLVQHYLSGLEKVCRWVQAQRPA